jgi:hypothetical protein
MLRLHRPFGLLVAGSFLVLVVASGAWSLFYQGPGRGLDLALLIALFAVYIVTASIHGTRWIAIALSVLPFVVASLGFLASSDLPIHDSYKFHFPVFQYIGDSLSAGASFPAWFPIGGGVRTGFFQIPLFYFAPHRLFGYGLFALSALPDVNVYKIQQLFGVLLLSAGWWLFLERLAQSRLAASFGTLVLAMGGTGLSWDQEQVLSTTCFVPWFLLAASHLTNDRRLLFAVAAMFGLAGTTHYPHILLISFLVWLVTVTVFKFSAVRERLASATLFDVAACLVLFLICLAPLVYFQWHSDILSSPVRFWRGAPMVARSYDEYVDLTLGAMPGSSAYPANFWQYVNPRMPPDDFSHSSFFVGRITLIFGLVGILLAPRRSLPIVLMTAAFACLTLGFRSPINFSESLFRLSPSIMGSFRQWFHFFPMVNFCLSALAAIGLAVTMERYGARLGRLAPPWLMLMFGLQLFELTYYDHAYLTKYTESERPMSLLSAAPGQESGWRFSNPKVIILQYADRLEVERCCKEALRQAPYLTATAVSVDGGFAGELAALRERLGDGADGVVTNIPASIWRDEIEPGPLSGQVQVTYQFDGADFDLAVDRPALLVTPLNHRLGLSASINGEAAEVWRVDGTLAGVIVPTGASRIAMRVTPDAYRIIAISQAVAVLALAVLMAGALARTADKPRGPGR